MRLRPAVLLFGWAAQLPKTCSDQLHVLAAQLGTHVWLRSYCVADDVLPLLTIDALW
jgi:hypothetical protein